MISKIRKLTGIFKYRKQLKASLYSFLNDEKLSKLLESRGINSLPQIQFRDLMDFYSKDYDNFIKIKSDFTNGISPDNDYYFICWIAKAVKTKKYFEIGTWVGLSAYNMAQNLGPEAEIYTLDIPADHPEIAVFDIPPEIFGHYAKNIKNIHFLKSDSKNFISQSYRKQFDMVFVDGNHSFEYVKNDTKIALELIKDENSVIAWHDYILGGELNKNVLAGILAGIPESEHKHLYSLNQSNLAVYSKAYNFRKMLIGKWDIPDLKFKVSIELNRD